MIDFLADHGHFAGGVRHHLGGGAAHDYLIQGVLAGAADDDAVKLAILSLWR